jgi:hypothetical protein
MVQGEERREELKKTVETRIEVSKTELLAGCGVKEEDAEITTQDGQPVTCLTIKNTKTEEVRRKALPEA